MLAGLLWSREETQNPGLDNLSVCVGGSQQFLASKVLTIIYPSNSSDSISLSTTTPYAVGRPLLYVFIYLLTITLQFSYNIL